MRDKAKDIQNRARKLEININRLITAATGLNPSQLTDESIAAEKQYHRSIGIHRGSWSRLAAKKENRQTDNRKRRKSEKKALRKDHEDITMPVSKRTSWLYWW